MDYMKAIEGLTTCDICDACDALSVSAVTSGAMQRVWSCGAICGPIETLKISQAGQTEIVIGTLQPIMSGAPGSILFVDAGGNMEFNTIGSLASVVALHRGFSGAVVNGCVRDVQGMEAMGFPVYACGTVVASVRGRVGVESVNEPVELNGKQVDPGWLMAADRNGIIAFPAERAADIFRLARRAVDIEKDIFDRIRAGQDPIALHHDLRYTASFKEQLSA